jgi:hypothetical protein
MEKRKMLYPVAKIITGEVDRTGTIICSEKDPENSEKFITFALTTRGTAKIIETEK